MRRLDKILKEPKYALAFSGGVDSTFLAAYARRRSKVFCITVDTPFVQRSEIKNARRTSEMLGLPHKVIKLPLPTAILKNPRDRCYKCKKFIFSRIKSLAEKEGLGCVIDGTNYDELSEDRPGLFALRELDIESPLALAGIGKKKIRSLSKKMGLWTWNKPSLSCLATRIPYGQNITHKKLRMIEQSEHFLKNLGFYNVRVRHYETIAKIEVDKKDIKRIAELAVQIDKKLKDIGFLCVTHDLGGYKSGGANV
ncbi:MAG: ATP-dependent sacrificial sulfur transferase LarE [Candidatus Woesearchaeota archaeon]